MVMRHHFFQQHCNHNVHQGLLWIQDSWGFREDSDWHLVPGTMGLPGMLKKRSSEIPAKRVVILVNIVLISYHGDAIDTQKAENNTITINIFEN